MRVRVYTLSEKDFVGYLQSFLPPVEDLAEIREYCFVRQVLAVKVGGTETFIGDFWICADLGLRVFLPICKAFNGWKTINIFGKMECRGLLK